MLECAQCSDVFTCELAKQEHCCSLRHQVRLLQISADSEHACTLCSFTSKQLAEYSKHVDSCEHQWRLAVLRRRIAIAEDLGIPSEDPSLSWVTLPASKDGGPTQQCGGVYQSTATNAVRGAGVFDLQNNDGQARSGPLLSGSYPSLYEFCEPYPKEMWNFQYSRPDKVPERGYRGKRQRDGGRRWIRDRDYVCTGHHAPIERPQNCLRKRSNSEHLRSRNYFRKNSDDDDEGRLGRRCCHTKKDKNPKAADAVVHGRSGVEEVAFSNQISKNEISGPNDRSNSNTGSEEIGVGGSNEANSIHSSGLSDSVTQFPALRLQEDHCDRTTKGVVPLSRPASRFTANTDLMKKYKKILMRSFPAYSQSRSFRMFVDRQMKYRLVNSERAATAAAHPPNSALPSNRCVHSAASGDGDGLNGGATSMGLLMGTGCSQPVDALEGLFAMDDLFAANLAKEGIEQSVPKTLQVPLSSTFNGSASQGNAVRKRVQSEPELRFNGSRGEAVVEVSPSRTADINFPTDEFSLKKVKSEASVAPEMDPTASLLVGFAGDAHSSQPTPSPASPDMNFIPILQMTSTCEVAPPDAVTIEKLRAMWRLVAEEHSLQMRKANLRVELENIEQSIASVRRQRTWMLDEAENR